MGLELKGSRFSEDQDIIRLLEAKSKAAEITDEGDASGLIEERTSGFATKNYVDSVFDSFATQEDVDNTYSGKAPASALGSSLLQLNDDREIDPSYLPSQSTRGARWFNGGSITTRMDIGDGGWMNNATSMATLTIPHSSMGNRPYYLLCYGQVEVKGNFAGSLPQLFISGVTAAGALNGYLAVGHGIPSWLSHYHVSIIPASRNDNSARSFNTNIYLTLSCRSEGASSDFTDYMGRWGALAIPVY